MTNSVIFYLSSCPSTSVLWYRHTISPLSSPFSTYIRPSLMTTPSSINHSLPRRFFIPAFFSSSTAFTIFLSSSYTFLILSLRFLSSTSISTPLIHSSLISVLSLLSFSIPSCQSALQLSLLALSMFFPRTCFRMKLNHSRYKAHWACLWFSF